MKRRTFIQLTFDSSTLAQTQAAVLWESKAQKGASGLRGVKTASHQPLEFTLKSVLAHAANMSALIFVLTSRRE